MPQEQECKGMCSHSDKDDPSVIGKAYYGDGQVRTLRSTQPSKVDEHAVRDTPDMVNHPPHYTKHPSGVECIEITEHMNFNLGSAMKYIWRADLKNDDIEDLEKARWYVDREIKRRKKQTNEQ